MEDELDKNMEEELIDNVEGGQADEDVSSGEKNEGPINKKQALLIGLVAVFILVIIILIKVLNVPPVPDANPTGYAVDKNELIQTEKRLSGEVQNVSLAADGTGSVTVLSHVVNVDVKDNFIQEVDVEYIGKEFVVTINNNTEFENKAAKDLVQGDKIIVDTNESIYLSENLVAENVVFYDKLAETIKQILGDTNMLGGVIKEKTEGSLTVTAEVVDREALGKMDLSGSYSVPTLTKDYEVSLNDEVEVTGKSLSELLVGDRVGIVTSEDVYQSNTLSAVQVFVITPEEEESLSDY